MQVDGIFLDAYTFAHVLKVCGLLGPTDKGQSMYMEAVLKGFERECFERTLSSSSKCTFIHTHHIQKQTTKTMIFQKMSSC